MSWDEYCVVCGGPPRFDSTKCPAGQNQASPVGTDWLSDWVGVTPEQPDEPIDIGQYDSCHSGCWKTTDGSRFAAYGQWEQCIAPNESRHSSCGHQGYGYATSATCGCSASWGGPRKRTYDIVCGMSERYGYTAPPDRGYSVEDSMSSDDPDAWESDCESQPACPAHAPEPGLHWLQADWGSSGRSSGWVRYGVAAHRSCVQLLQGRLDYSLNFSHVWPLLHQPKPDCHHDPSTRRYYVLHDSTNQLKCSYGGIDQYYGVAEVHHRECSCFAFCFVSPEDEYMLLDPLQCSSNADRIVQVWEPLVQQFHPGWRFSAAEDAGGSCLLAAALQAESVAKTQNALASTETEDIATSVLQLVFSHAGSPRDQLVLAAQLLPLSSTMPQLLAGRMQLAVAVNTWPRVQHFATWLHRYGGLVSSLHLDAAVGCCAQDAERSNTAVLDVIARTAANFKQGFKLLSFSAYVDTLGEDTSKQLLQSLPLAHLTALHLTGPWTLSAPAAAAALTAATALQDLTLPGAGLGEALEAQAVVLPAGLLRLRLSDAGACSAAILRMLSDQLSSLTHLALDDQPLSESHAEFASIEREAQDCWAQLPTLRSLQLGSRQVPLKYNLDSNDEHLMDGDPQAPQPPQRQYIQVSRRLLDSIAALTGLTSLTLGPSAWLQEPPEGSGLWGLSRLLPKLTGLQQLVLNMQVGEARADNVGAQKAVRVAVEGLPKLEVVAVSAAMCGREMRR